MSHTGNSTAREHPFRVLAIFPHPSLKNCLYSLYDTIKPNTNSIFIFPIHQGKWPTPNAQSKSADRDDASSLTVRTLFSPLVTISSL